MSEHTFMISEKSLNGKICAGPDFVLENTQVYQINCQVTYVITGEFGNKFVKHQTLTTVCVNGKIIGDGLEYKLDNICVDFGMENYIDDFCTTILIKNNKFCINITPLQICDLNIFATIKITAFN